MTERTRNQIEMAGMSFLCRVAWLSLRGGVEFGVELLPLYIKRRQMRWLGVSIRRSLDVSL